MNTQQPENGIEIRHAKKPSGADHIMCVSFHEALDAEKSSDKSITIL